MIAIKCPKCGCEYLPGEIYIPKYFLGQPRDIVREQGMIKFAAGLDQDLEEDFHCHYCGIQFHVKAFMNFATSYKEEEDFENYTTKIR